MKTKLILLALLLLTGMAIAATFTYKCPRCGLIQEYTWPGIYKCPNDGSTMNQR